MREGRAHELLGDLGKARGRRNRRVERHGARDRVQIGEANADRHGPTGQAIWPAAGHRSCPRDERGWDGKPALQRASCRSPIVHLPIATDDAS